MVCRGLLLKVLEAELLPLLVRPSRVRGRLLASEAQILPYCSRRLTTSSIKGGKALQNRTKAGNTGGKSCCLSSEVSTVNDKQKSIKNTDHQSVEMNQNLTFLFKGHSSVKKYFYCCAKRCFVKTP